LLVILKVLGYKSTISGHEFQKIPKMQVAQPNNSNAQPVFCKSRKN
jgi:hypothetical protein